MYIMVTDVIFAQKFKLNMKFRLNSMLCSALLCSSVQLNDFEYHIYIDRVHCYSSHNKWRRMHLKRADIETDV